MNVCNLLFSVRCDLLFLTSGKACALNFLLIFNKSNLLCWSLWRVVSKGRNHYFCIVNKGLATRHLLVLLANIK